MNEDAKRDNLRYVALRELIGKMKLTIGLQIARVDRRCSFFANRHETTRHVLFSLMREPTSRAMYNGRIFLTLERLAFELLSCYYFNGPWPSFIPVSSARAQLIHYFAAIEESQGYPRILPYLIPHCSCFFDCCGGREGDGADELASSCVS